MSNPSVRQPITPELLQKHEHAAQAIRGRANVGCFEPFFPFEHLDALRVRARYLDEAPELDAAIQGIDAKEFSGWGKALPDGSLIVVLNRLQTQARTNVTLLEEVAHHHYGHAPTCVGSLGRTEYSPADEQEAQFTAAAALLPARVVAMGVYQRKDGKALAASFGASEELFEQRVKTLGLWDLYERPLAGGKIP